MQGYDHKRIEQKWQKRWDEEELYKSGKGFKNKPKCYVLDMFPYPSGEGLHVGHPRGYIASDIYSRFKRMSGHDVLHPMGWDAFGLPAENYAIKNKIHPRDAVERNIARFKEQLSKIGFDYDWDREINTTDPEYYRWTQWIFLKLFERGLAYESDEPINWCPSCRTGLALEDLEEGRCERCGSAVEQKPLRQWVLKIREYADRLLDGLDSLEWPESVKESQRNWIGRSEGAEIEFRISLPAETLSVLQTRSAKAENLEFLIKVFTTRPDTIFGATYLVLSPEHPLIENLESKISNLGEVRKYIEAAKHKTDLERTESKEKTGVELEGVYALNPANDEKIPIWVADYVLAHYGTGAIMAVPAHDKRDFEFSQKYNLPVRHVIEPVYWQSAEPGKVKNGISFDNRDSTIVIVEHWSKEKYIGLKWKKVALGTFITGGVEERQTAKEAAQREIREETGFLNPELVEDYGVVHGKFYHAPQKINRFAHSRVLHFKLKDDGREKISEDKKEKHEILWLSKDELKNFLTPDSHHRALELLNGESVYTGEGMLTNSGKFNEIDSAEAKEKITEFVNGEKRVTYRLRDWVFSRQRYWGEPIPLVFCEHCANKIKNQKSKIKKEEFSKGELLNPGWIAVPEGKLPVVLPEVESYEPTGTGDSPLVNIKEWTNTTCPKCGGPAQRETNTMPQWAGSSWYYLRYIDPHNDDALVDAEKEKYWMAPARQSPKGGGGVDMYVGGIEHATRHLIYARFWHKFLYDIKVVSSDEPFARLRNQGLIYGEDGKKMSKRWGNVVSPDSMIERFGADALRIYEMFMGPFEDTISWNTDGVVGTKRFLEKVWRQTPKVERQVKNNKHLEFMLHQTIKKVTEDIKNFKFNTAISAMMIFANSLDKERSVPYAIFIEFICLLAPFAPHMSEELWQVFGEKGSVHTSLWPAFDPDKAEEKNSAIIVQVDGKVRATLKMPSGAEKEEVIKEARSNESILRFLKGKEEKDVIYVAQKLVNFVTKSPREVKREST